MKKILLLSALLVLTIATLLAQPIPVQPDNYNDEDAGTISNPLHISSLENLLWLSVRKDYWGNEDTKYYFSQTNDIDASELVNWETEDDYKLAPIGYELHFGDEVISKPFYGIYKGNTYKITSFYMDYSQSDSYDGVGLFGYIKNGTVDCLGMEDAIVKGKNKVGAIVGKTEDSYLDMCAVYGEVEGLTHVGMIAGDMTNGHIFKSYARGKLKFNEIGGGLAGATNNTNITYSFFNGYFVDSSCGGGLVGDLTESSKIEYCYAAFPETGINLDEFGGLAYNIVNNAMISESRFNSCAMAYAHETGTCGVQYTHKNSEFEMTSNFGYFGWDFEDTWAFDENINNGYPYLQVGPVDNFDENQAVIPTISCSNYPNPFNPTTTIEFSIPKNSNVSLEIYNLKGQIVKTLVDNNITAGTHKVVWNGTNQSNNTVASGIYFYKIKTNNQTITNKIVMMK